MFKTLICQSRLSAAAVYQLFKTSESYNNYSINERIKLLKEEGNEAIEDRTAIRDRERRAQQHRIKYVEEEQERQKKEK